MLWPSTKKLWMAFCQLLGCHGSWRLICPNSPYTSYETTLHTHTRTHTHTRMFETKQFWLPLTSAIWTIFFCSREESSRFGMTWERVNDRCLIFQCSFFLRNVLKLDQDYLDIQKMYIYIYIQAVKVLSWKGNHHTLQMSLNFTFIGCWISVSPWVSDSYSFLALSFSILPFPSCVFFF